METDRRKGLIWSTVESKTSRYFLLLPDGTSTPDDLLRGRGRHACIEFIRFFSENDLLTVPAFDSNGVFIDREYWDGDLTVEGEEMIRRNSERWLDSKDAKKDLPKYKTLHKILSEIRASRSST